MEELRQFLDAILQAINSESLTDEEFESIDLPASPLEYNKATYEALKTVLETREEVSGQRKRLKLYFLSRGADLDGASATYIPKSNILYGGAI